MLEFKNKSKLFKLFSVLMALMLILPSTAGIAYAAEQPGCVLITDYISAGRASSGLR